MKKSLIGILASAALVLGFVPSAQASAFLSITVGGVNVNCNNTVACGAGFTTALNSNTIEFAGTVNGVSFTDVSVTGNQPGGIASFSTGTTTAATNPTGAPLAVTISFASNNYSLPVGSPVFFNAAQGGDALVSTGAITYNFTGWGDGGNGLVPGVGTASVAPACVTGTAPPTSTCSATGPTTQFVRAGNFALSGTQTFTLGAGASANAHGSVTAFANPQTTVPEPGTMMLLGTGLLGLAAAARRRRAKQ